MSALPTVMLLTMRRIGRCPVRWKTAPYSTLPQLLVPRLPDRIQLKLATLAQLLMDSMLRSCLQEVKRKTSPKRLSLWRNLSHYQHQEHLTQLLHQWMNPPGGRHLNLAEVSLCTCSANPFMFVIISGWSTISWCSFVYCSFMMLMYHFWF